MLATERFLSRILTNEATDVLIIQSNQTLFDKKKKKFLSEQSHTVNQQLITNVLAFIKRKDLIVFAVKKKNTFFLNTTRSEEAASACEQKNIVFSATENSNLRFKIRFMQIVCTVWNRGQLQVNYFHL